MIIQPPSVLLAGPSGSGKTSSIATQLLCGLEVFVVVTEPDGVASLLDAAERLKAPIDNLHWSQCFPHSSGWMELQDMIQKVSTMDQKQLSDQRDMGKSSFRPAALKFLSAFSNFQCDRTGENYGDFTKWGDGRSLCIDSFTGFCSIGWGCTVGFKPTANPGEWGIAQNFVYNMLSTIDGSRHCFFTMTAHVEKELDEMTGVRRVMVSAIGAKLAPKIPKFFGDVVKCSRTMGQPGKAIFRWATLDDSMDLKNRTLPISDKLEPDFRPVVEAYRRRIALAQRGTVAVLPVSAGAQPLPAPKQLPAAPMSPSKPAA